MLKIIRTTLTSWKHLQDLLLRHLKEIFLQTNWTRYIGRFSFVFELCCLCREFSRYLKDIFKNLHLQGKTKSGTCINYGNSETHTLIPTQKPNPFGHKRYKGRRILKFEFVFTLNNGDCQVVNVISFVYTYGQFTRHESDQLFNQTNNNDNNNDKNKN